MSTTSPRTATAAVAERLDDRAPRPALWCQSTARSICANPSSAVRVFIDESAVQPIGWRVGDGEARILVAPSWRWPSAEVDMVGELELTDGPGGMSIVGWWSPVTATLPAGTPTELRMEVAGMTLWDATRRICTEDHARIVSLLA